MISHPLLDALIQPSRPLPAQFRSGVGMPQKLPRLLRYGPVAPPQVGGSRFTGGQVAQPQTSLAHPQAAEGFTPPHFNPSNPTAPSLAPFVQTAQGGQPTGPPFNMAGGTGGDVLPPRPSPTSNPLAGTLAPGPSSGLGGPLHQGGYDNAAQGLASVLGLGTPAPAVSAPQSPSSLLTALMGQQSGLTGQALETMQQALQQAIFAQQGQRVNPSIGTANRYAA